MTSATWRKKQKKLSRISAINNGTLRTSSKIRILRLHPSTAKLSSDNVKIHDRHPYCSDEYIRRRIPSRISSLCVEHTRSRGKTLLRKFLTAVSISAYAEYSIKLYSFDVLRHYCTFQVQFCKIRKVRGAKSNDIYSFVVVRTKDKNLLNIVISKSILN